MAVNYSSKYAGVMDERFKLKSLTTGIINGNFEWIGVKTVNVFSRDLATLNDYKTSGSNRYGTPEELMKNVGRKELTQCQSLKYMVNDISTEKMNKMLRAMFLDRVDNLVIPAIDTYRLGVIATNVPTAGTVSGKRHIVTNAVNKFNAFEEFLACQEVLDDDRALLGGRIAIVTPSYLNKIKLDDNFTKWGDMAQKMMINGIVGMIDDVPVIKVPASYLPADVDFMITNPLVAPAPVKLQEFKINYNVPGISGVLVEARVCYDCFVLDKKKDAIAVHKNA